MMQFHLTTDPNRDAVLHYYNALIRSNISPSAHSYKLLLDAYAVLPPVDIESLVRVFNELVADRRTPVSGTHWASMITAHGLYASDPERAMKIFDSIATHPTATIDLQAEPVVWEAILSVAAQKSTVSELERLHQQMVSTGARATAYVYNVLISGYARAGQIVNARSIFNTMGDSISGVAAPNNHPQLLTSSGHVKPSTITDTPTIVVYREPSTYEAMIRAELGHGTMENAEEVLQMMQARMYPVAVYMNVQNLISDHLVSVLGPVIFPPDSKLLITFTRHHIQSSLGAGLQGGRTSPLTIPQVQAEAQSAAAGETEPSPARPLMTYSSFTPAPNPERMNLGYISPPNKSKKGEARETKTGDAEAAESQPTDSEPQAANEATTASEEVVASAEAPIGSGTESEIESDTPATPAVSALASEETTMSEEESQTDTQQPEEIPKA